MADLLLGMIFRNTQCPWWIIYCGSWLALDSWVQPTDVSYFLTFVPNPSLAPSENPKDAFLYYALTYFYSSAWRPIVLELAVCAELYVPANASRLALKRTAMGVSVQVCSGSRSWSYE